MNSYGFLKVLNICKLWAFLVPVFRNYHFVIFLLYSNCKRWRLPVGFFFVMALINSATIETKHPTVSIDKILSTRCCCFSILCPQFTSGRTPKRLRGKQQKSVQSQIPWGSYAKIVLGLIFGSDAIHSNAWVNVL